MYVRPVVYDPGRIQKLDVKLIDNELKRDPPLNLR